MRQCRRAGERGARYFPYFATAGFLGLPRLAAASTKAAEASTHLGIPDLLWKSVNLLLFFGILVWLLYKPLSSYFARRQDGIRESLATARKRREEAALLAASIHEKVAGLEREIAAVSERSREDGERELLRIASEGEAEAERLLKQVAEEIDNRLRVAKKELRRDAAELATDLARQRLAAGLVAQDRERIFEESLARFSGESS